VDGPLRVSFAKDKRKDFDVRVLDGRVNRGRTTQKSRSARLRNEKDGLAVLRADHENIQSEYEGFQTSGGDDRYFLANRILRALARHDQLEAEVFYPAVQWQAERQGHRKAASLLREAVREHQAMDQRMDRLNDVMQDDVFLRQVDALMEKVQAHVEREERELFPVAQTLLGEAGLARLGRNLQQRKDQIEQQFGV
jgi:hemerythrin superfamily protein